MGRGFLVRLAAGQEGDAGDRGRHAGLEHLHGFLGHFLDRGALGGFLARNDHVGLEHGAFQGHARLVELVIDRAQHPFGDAVAGVDVVGAVHQDLGLDDRHDLLFLAERRIAGERVRIGLDAGPGRNPVADIDDGAPLGELRAQRAIFGKPLAQPIETFGDDLARAVGQGLGPLVDLDAGQRPRLLDHLDQRGAVLGVLADGLVVEDDARDMVAHRIGRPKQQLAVVAPVGRKNAPAGGAHGRSHLVQFGEVHCTLLMPDVRR